MVEKDAYVTMLRASGQGEDSQWFDYMPNFFTNVIRVEWDKGTMEVVLPADIAAVLVARGYAKPYLPEVGSVNETLQEK